MPALIYRLYFFAHSLRSLERNILRFSGFGPIRRTLIGRIEEIDQGRREQWLNHVYLLGQQGK
jgi:hypothetical protein